MPLVLLQHFRGNLDNWDPALIDALALARRVVTFDNAGVGGSTGTTPDTIEQMARDAIAFVAAMEFNQADLLGFSIGSFVAQQIALTRPTIVRRLVLASSAPRGAAGIHGWAPEVIGAVGTPQTSSEAYLDVFFTPSRPPASGSFLGYCFRPRVVRRSRDNRLFCGFNPAVSSSALKAMRTTIRELDFRHQTQLSLVDIARRVNPLLRGWKNTTDDTHHRLCLPCFDTLITCFGPG